MKKVLLLLYLFSIDCIFSSAQEDTVIVDVPKVHVTFGNGNNWSSSNWLGKKGKTVYEEATIKIEGGALYEDMEETPIAIRGRGNSSWSNSASAKNPYRIKFEEQCKPFDLTKGKSWILLANRQQGSMLTNVVGMYLAKLFDVVAYNDMIPVDLYINNSYRGSYNFTEKIGFSNNSVDLADESKASMIEIDIYQDESICRTNAFNLKTKVHEPDLQDIDDTRLIDSASIYRDFDRMMLAIKEQDKPLSNYIDIDKLTRYLIVNELILNSELSEPKSVFLFSENVLDDLDPFGIDHTPWIFGPLWDLDWSYGYHLKQTYFKNCSTQDYFSEVLEQPGKNFWSKIRNNPEVDKLYYRLWTEFIEEDGLSKLFDYLEDYVDFVLPSFERDKTNETSSKNKTDYKTQLSSCKKWFNERVDKIYSNLTEYPLDESYTLHIPASGWTTVCVPFSFDVPEDLELYKVTINELYNDSLQLSLVDEVKANKPYLVNGQEGDYLLSGRFVSTSKFTNGKKDKYLTHGNLKGSLADVYAPVSTYVLSEDKTGCFSRVDSLNSELVNSNHAYLVLPDEIDLADNLYFNSGAELSIKQINHKAEKKEQLYNIYGMPVSHSYRGFVISQEGHYYK